MLNKGEKSSKELKHKEIERKFLVPDITKLGDLTTFDSVEIAQYYLMTSPQWRLRLRGQQAFMTFKGNGTLIRNEFEFRVPRFLFHFFKFFAIGKTIRKTRYLIPFRYKTDDLDFDLLFEFDVFKGSNSWLQMLEVEFKSEEESRIFDIIKPSYFGEEVTHDKRYQNKNLIY